MGNRCIAPQGAGLINYLFGNADSAFGAHLWKNWSDASNYASDAQEYLNGMTCSVIKDEYASDSATYQWKVLCCGKG